MITRCGRGGGLGYLIAFGLGMWFARKKMHRGHHHHCEFHREAWHHGPPPGAQHGPWCHGPWCHNRQAPPSGNNPPPNP
jgi:hypothetical protein